VRISSVTSIIAAGISAAGVLGALYFGSTAHVMERHQRDLQRTRTDLRARAAGCEAGMRDLEKFGNHLGSFLSDKENEVLRLKEQIASIRTRIGNVEKIKSEYESLEKELVELKEMLPVKGGAPKEGR